MSVLVIGGDNLDSIKERLKEKGFENIEHISGRKKGDRKIKISEKTDLVLVLTDYACHNIMGKVKQITRRDKLKIIYSKRSWICMKDKIEEYITDKSRVN
ncbi:DUF2325 domain-containing protein [Clostridium sp. DJ247]|uniref:DUF2325 domain-containing protein n=1 Tax=Clostridium sp. DJ247 TaxID=2726188 RepID=UPI001625372B|nr:DUF2325 domain-containing protein [Clostridium sp. DJ247]MBC2582184.1 DUF2325 domain-containing protein [Clostridium sp. DJ247]